jgi:hypothetical protein
LLIALASLVLLTPFFIVNHALAIAISGDKIDSNFEDIGADFTG